MGVFSPGTGQNNPPQAISKFEISADLTGGAEQNPTLIKATAGKTPKDVEEIRALPFDVAPKTAAIARDISTV